MTIDFFIRENVGENASTQNFGDKLAWERRHNPILTIYTDVSFYPSHFADECMDKTIYE